MAPPRIAGEVEECGGVVGVSGWKVGIGESVDGDEKEGEKDALGRREQRRGSGRAVGY